MCLSFSVCCIRLSLAQASSPFFVCLSVFSHRFFVIPRNDERLPEPHVATPEPKVQKVHTAPTAAHRSETAGRLWFFQNSSHRCKQEGQAHCSGNLLWTRMADCGSMGRRSRSHRRRLDVEQASANSPNCQGRPDNPGRPKPGVEIYHERKSRVRAHGPPVWNLHKGEGAPSRTVSGSFRCACTSALENHRRTRRHPEQQLLRMRKM